MRSFRPREGNREQCADRFIPTDWQHIQIYMTYLYLILSTLLQIYKCYVPNYLIV